MFGEVISEILACDSLFQSLCQLVGAGSGLRTALDAFDGLDDIFGGTADAESSDALSIAAAAAGELNSGDNAVFDLEVDLSGADALGNVRISHDIFPFYG